MQTRRAAKKQRIETGPLLGPVHLPAEVIGNNLLRCPDLPSLLHLSTCNSAVKREVFRKQIGEGENASIWQVIDFGSVSKEMASKLTDDQLKKLLVKCRAKEVTTILKLTGCVGLTGKGLEPLRGSIVLREIDLRLSNMEGLESTYVLSLLSSMPPIAPVPASFGNRHLGLSLVKFPVYSKAVDNWYKRFSYPAGNWLRKHNKAVQLKAIELRTSCGHCKGAICDRWSEDDMWWVMNGSYCEVCKKLTCRGEMAINEKASECPCVGDCFLCMAQSCQWNDKCKKGSCDIMQCFACDVDACDDCVDWQWCYKCEERFCGRDECSRSIWYCHGCGCTHCSAC